MLLTSSFKRSEENIKEKSYNFHQFFIVLIVMRENTPAMSRSTVILAFFYIVMHLVNGYQNAYDLLEQRNQRIYEPRYFQTKTFYDNRNRFFDQNRNFQQGYYPNAYFSKFDNGYDNLGNGIPVKYFHPFRRHLFGNWQFERQPFRERTSDNFYYEGYPTLRPEYEHVNYRSKEFYPSVYSNIPALRRKTGNQFISRGKTDFTKTDRITDDNEDKMHKKTDEFHQRTHDGVNIDSLKKEKTGEQLHTDQAEENKSSLRSNKVVKKGRTTKGFAVHHHKDETGNSTTFFDEISDFGGQSDLRDIADGFSTRRTSEQMTHKGDEKHFEENEAQKANYGSGLFTGKQKLEKDFSSLSGHDESENKFHTGNERDDFELKKTFRYLNADRFDYTEPNVDNYYYSSTN